MPEVGWVKVLGRSDEIAAKLHDKIVGLVAEIVHKLSDPGRSFTSWINA